MHARVRDPTQLRERVRAERMRRRPRRGRSRECGARLRSAAQNIKGMHAVRCALLLMLLLVGEAAAGGHNATCDEYDVRSHANFKRLPMNVCGENHADRIIGGRAAALGEYPWMARIGYLLEECADTKVEYRCGGALITPTIVVTAAHCLTSLPINRCSSSRQFNKYYPYMVRLGEVIIRTNPDCAQGVCAAKVQDIRIDQIIPHPEYNTPKLRNDIGLIRLSREANFNGWVNPLCILQGHTGVEDFLNHTGVVAGWGIINPTTGESSKQLMKLSVPIVPFEMCSEAFKRLAKLSDRHQICAGGIQGQDSCSGDSGGPLFVVGDTAEGPRFHILGVVSFGFKRCAERPIPAVYTNFLHYSKWIMDNL